MTHLEIDVFIVQMPDDAFQLDVLLQSGLGQLLCLCQLLSQLVNRPIRDAQLVLLLSQFLKHVWIIIVFSRKTADRFSTKDGGARSFDLKIFEANVRAPLISIQHSD